MADDFENFKNEDKSYIKYRRDKKFMEESWERHQKFILNELIRLNENIEKLTEKTQKNEIDISTMKVQTSILAVVAGTIASVGTTLLGMLGKF